MSTMAHEDIFKKDGWEVLIDDFKDIVEAKLIPIIDVREPHEVAAVRVDAGNFVNIPLKELDTAMKMSDNQFQSKYSRSKPGKEDAIIILCGSGKRSNLGLKVMRENDYLNTRHYNGGTRVWMERYPEKVIKSNS